MSYAISFRGTSAARTGWSGYGGLSFDEAGCREAGGDWDPATGRCNNIAKHQCENRGGTWNPSTLVCDVEGSPNQPAPELCRAKGYYWDYVQGLCYEPDLPKGGPMPGGGGDKASAATGNVVPLAIGVAAVAGLVWWLRK